MYSGYLQNQSSIESHLQGKCMTYHKLLIDNPKCQRRFHLCYETGEGQVQAEVRIDCPYCGARIFEKKNHPPVVLAREENLVKAPTGENEMMYECFFKS